MHIGLEIQKKLHERKMTVVYFSSQIPCTRANVYKIFKQKSIDTDLLLRISRILEFDFFNLYKSELTDNNSTEHCI